MGITSRAAVLAALLPGLAAAQAPTPPGSIRGLVYDSLLASGALGGAIVELFELGRVTTADSRGVFRFDSLPAGRYTLSFSHPTLAEIGLTPPDRIVQLGAGIDVAVTLATPSTTTLLRRYCPGPRERATGVLLGTLLEAIGRAPLAGGEVRAEWSVTTLDRAAGFVSRPPVIRAAADSSGRYQLCGIPTDVPVLLRMFARGREGSPLELRMADRPIVVRHLSLDLSDSTRRNRGRIAGRVTAAGEPLAEAQVLLLGSQGVVRTGADGGFELTGLPAGTHTIEARAIGYARQRTAIDLEPDKTARLDFSLVKQAVELPELTVSAGRSARSGFEERRRLGVGGYFVTGEDVRKRGSIRVEDVFRTVPGMRVEPAGLTDYRILSYRGGSGFSAVCEPSIFIDGIRIPLDAENGLSLPVIPEELDGIEVHQSPNSAPIQYRSIGQNCGVILIWTRRGRR